MFILLSGAFGNIGQNVINFLVELGYNVRCFDIKTKQNEKICKDYLKVSWIQRKLEPFWGDITNVDNVNDAVKNVDVIIHLAAIIPPLSEKKPDLAKAVNVEGTRNLVEAAKKLDPLPKFIFTSSVSIYGPRMSDPPPRKITDPYNPTDNYTHHKVECEKIIKESGLPWTILRVAAVSVTDVMGSIDPIMFEIPLDQRIEFVHAKDVARAIVNSITANVVGKILHVGGGNACQMLQRDFMKKMLGAAGVGMLPENAFIKPQKDSEWFYTDFMDTEEAQKLLHYQVLTFDDYIEELKKIVGPGRYFAKMFSPSIKMALSFKSQYYKDHVKDRFKFWSKTESEFEEIEEFEDTETD
ncbi:MAG: NAD-dependent epimerase/dehydratase family protein [Candidatus Helarchaeota archaeon]